VLPAGAYAGYAAVPAPAQFGLSVASDLLLVGMALSVYKPWGRTPWAAEQRRGRTAASAR
jgi:hypothetical protein